MHDQRVAEVDRAALAVGQAAVVEHLQQHVEHVRVRLLDLVEQDHLVGPPPHRLGQRAALLVADIAGRRADQPRDRVLLHVLRHVDADHRRARRRTGTRPAPWSARSCRRRSGPRNRNEPIGRFGSCSPARARRTAVETACTASSWPTTRLRELVLHVQQLLALAFEHLVDRDAGPARDDLRRCGRRHRLLDHVAGSRPCASASFELLLELRDDAVGELARLGEVAAPLRLVELGRAPGRAAP